MASEDNGWSSEYDDILADLERDDREGDHVAVVSDVKRGTWPSGEGYVDVDLLLSTANNATVNIRFNDKLITKAEYAAKKDGMTRGQTAGLANAIRLRKALSQHFGIGDPATIKRGQRFGVKVVKTKDSGKGSFPRVIAIMPVESIKPAGDRKTASAGDVPF